MEPELKKKPPLLMGSRWVPPHGAAGSGAFLPPRQLRPLRTARAERGGGDWVEKEEGCGTPLPALTLSRQFTFSVGYTIFPQRAQLGFMAAPLPPQPPPRPPLGRRPRAAPLNKGGGGGRRGGGGARGGAAARAHPRASPRRPHARSRTPLHAQIAAPYTTRTPPRGCAAPLRDTTLRAGTRTRFAPRAAPRVASPPHPPPHRAVPHRNAARGAERQPGV